MHIRLFVVNSISSGSKLGLWVANIWQTRQVAKPNAIHDYMIDKLMFEIAGVLKVCNIA